MVDVTVRVPRHIVISLIVGLLVIADLKNASGDTGSVCVDQSTFDRTKVCTAYP